jgi:hypothetical protein
MVFSTLFLFHYLFIYICSLLVFAYTVVVCDIADGVICCIWKDYKQEPSIFGVYIFFYIHTMMANINFCVFGLKNLLRYHGLDLQNNLFWLVREPDKWDGTV